MIEKTLCDVWYAILPDPYDGTTIIDAERGRKWECRAFRIVGDSLKFLFLKVQRRYADSSLTRALESIVRYGVKVKFRINDKDGYLKFAFLGFTETTLKSGQIILLQKPVNNEDPTPSPAALLKKFGTLGDVFKRDGPGKYVARLGLSFSNTVESVNPSPTEVAQMHDHYAGNGVLTTDGCGIIRESFAKEIRTRHNFDSRTSGAPFETVLGTIWRNHKVFQIRRGGIKGLLVAYPDVWFDRICEQNAYTSTKWFKIAYRPSMLKYDGGPTHVEINRISEPPRSARLSASIIILLLSLCKSYGETKNLLTAFSELLKLQLRSIEMIAYDRQEALAYIEGELDAEGDSFYQDLYEMLYAGQSLDDAYIRKMLRDCQRIQYDTLRKKLNIRVTKSCFVYGVVDELDVLEEDEVFIYLPQREGIVVSKVLIARHPSYRPSDIRVLRAVDKPELHFLTDCIVFPGKGQYSVPGSMSGGDLDGDRFFVSWEPSILPFRTKWPYRSNPETYAQGIDWSKTDLNQSLISLFVDQRQNKVLGRAAIEWQDVVDRYWRLAASRYPLKLAGIIETALDLLKNGGSHRAHFSRFRRLLMSFHAERNGIRVRRSKLRRLRNMIPSIDEDRKIEYIPDPDLNLQAQKPQAWSKYYDEGRKLITHFNRRLAEAISKDEAYRHADGIEGDEDHHPIGDYPKYADAYKTRFINQYFPRHPGGILSADNLNLYLRASAWYCVGYERGKPAFAWLGARFLNNIKSYETNAGQPGMSIGALKKLQSANSPLTDPQRDMWYYYRGTGRTGQPAYCLACMTVGQLDSTDHRDDESNSGVLVTENSGLAEAIL